MHRPLVVATATTQNRIERPLLPLKDVQDPIYLLRLSHNQHNYSIAIG
jgi:hypothetical protein